MKIITKNFILQSRDEDILQALGKYRFLTTNHIQELFFQNNKSKTSFARRLQGLKENNYIDFIPTFDKERRVKSVNCYFLTKKGFDFLSERFDYNGYFFKKSNENGNLFLDHSLACIDFRMKCEKDISDNNKIFIEKWITQFDIKNPEAPLKKDRLLLSYEFYDDISRKNLSLFPDDLFAIKFYNDPNKSVKYFIEIDNNTESNTTRLREKFRKYDLLLKDYNYREFLSGSAVRILFTTTSQKKCINLIEMLKEDKLLQGLHKIIFFTDFQQIENNNVFSDAIWFKSDGQIIPLIK